MSTEIATNSNTSRTPQITNGYKLGYYKQANGRIKEAVVHIELLGSSKLVDERQHEIYDFLKTDLVKILKIEALGNLSDKEKLESIYITKKPELKYEVKEGEIVR